MNKELENDLRKLEKLWDTGENIADRRSLDRIKKALTPQLTTKEKGEVTLDLIDDIRDIIGKLGDGDISPTIAIKRIDIRLEKEELKQSTQPNTGMKLTPVFSTRNLTVAEGVKLRMIIGYLNGAFDDGSPLDDFDNKGYAKWLVDFIERKQLLQPNTEVEEAYKRVTKALLIEPNNVDVLESKTYKMEKFVDDLNTIENFIKESIPPRVTQSEIVKVLTPQYENWYARFDKIEIDETGVYARCNKDAYDDARFIIFKIIGELMETSVCSHLKLEHIDMISTFFAQEVESDE